MIQIIPVNTKSKIVNVQKLAFEILHEVYDSIIPSVHTDYFLKEFQSEKAIANQIKNENYSYYLLTFNSGNVGYFGIQNICNEKLVLSKLYISKSFRGQKIGKAALDFIFQYATENRIQLIELIVNQENENTIYIYKKYGFQIKESIINSFPNGHSVKDYKMEKVLNPI
ncbi:MAG: GNAT family N-acetyltransferase [Fulvivirga sp.]